MRYIFTENSWQSVYDIETTAQYTAMILGIQFKVFIETVGIKDEPISFWGDQAISFWRQLAR